MEQRKGREMKIISLAPSAKVMKISPEIAEEWLATSPGNRPIRDWYVKLLAAAMRRGEWRVSSQGVGFDIHGRLRDAHHRLLACVQSGVTIESVVVFGLSEDAYQVMDTGLKRRYADLLSEDNRVAEVLRLGCQFALGTSKPTVAQMLPVISGGLGDACKTLVEYCGSSRKYISSAPIKLAACVSIMFGEDSNYVLGQYRALCLQDFDSMSDASKSLERQVTSAKVRASDTMDTLARGFRVFNKCKMFLSKIQISQEDMELSVKVVKTTLLNSIKSNA